MKSGIKNNSRQMSIAKSDWIPISLSQISDFITKGSTPTTFGFSWTIDGIVFLRSECISENGLDLAQSMFISVQTHCFLRRSEIKPADILITITGNVGRVIILGSDFGVGNINQHIARVRINCSGVDKNFVYHSLTQKRYRKYFESIITGQAYPQISLKQVRETTIPLPPTLEEQTAIANALSDADALISGLEKLIAKKRAIKQGAMQELLTGKKRMPGFAGEWEEKRLGEIVDIVSGGTPKTNIPEYWDGEIRWCTPTDITRTDEKYLSVTERCISHDGLNNSSAQLLPIGTVLLCSRATIGVAKIAINEICTNQGFKSLICGPLVDNEYLYYLILTMRDNLLEKAIGSTFLEISKKDVSSLVINLPLKEEQSAIAQVLSDMDSEISALEAKLTKYRAIKQGMMQELLTGKTRPV